jgi:hypothetical protein
MLILAISVGCWSERRDSNSRPPVPRLAGSSATAMAETWVGSRVIPAECRTSTALSGRAPPYNASAALDWAHVGWKGRSTISSGLGDVSESPGGGAGAPWRSFVVCLYISPSRAWCPDPRTSAVLVANFEKGDVPDTPLRAHLRLLVSPFRRRNASFWSIALRKNMRMNSLPGVRWISKVTCHG